MQMTCSNDSTYVKAKLSSLWLAANSHEHLVESLQLAASLEVQCDSAISLLSNFLCTACNSTTERAMSVTALLHAAVVRRIAVEHAV